MEDQNVSESGAKAPVKTTGRTKMAAMHRFAGRKPSVLNCGLNDRRPDVSYNLLVT